MKHLKLFENFEEALQEIGVELPESIKGYKEDKDEMFSQLQKK